MVINGLLTLLFVGMLVHHAVGFARRRQPYRVAFLAFWGLLLFAHLGRRDDLYSVIALNLVAAILLKARERTAPA